MRRVLFLAACAGLAALCACSPPEPAHDVAYYRDHADARAAKLTACRTDKGKLAATNNCINALAADGAAVSQKFWQTPKAAPRVRDPGKL